MQKENPSFGNVAPGQRSYNGQLLSRGGNATHGFSGMPGGIQRLPGGQKMPGGGPGMPARVQAIPATVPAMAATVPRIQSGVARMPGGLTRMLAGGQMPTGVPGMEGGVPRIPGAVPVMSGGITGRPGVLGRSNGVAGTTGIVPSGSGGYGVHSGSSFMSRGGMNKRGEIRMTRGGATSQRGFGMSAGTAVHRARAVPSGVKPRGGRGVFRGGIGTSRGARISQNVTGIARIGGLGMGRGGLKFSGGTGYTRGIEITYKRMKRGVRGTGSTRGVRGLTGSTRGVRGLTGSTRGVGRFTGSTRGVRGLTGSTRGVGVFAGTTRGAGGLSGNMRGAGGLTRCTRGVGGFSGNARGAGGSTGSIRGVAGLAGSAIGPGGFTGSAREAGEFTGITRGVTRNRVMTKGGGGFHGVKEKQGEANENVMTGVVHQYEKTTTRNREIEVIDLDQTIDMTDEKPTINDQRVDQVPLSEEDIRDRYYRGLKNFEEKCYDINGNNKNSDKRTADKNDADGSLKVLDNPNITVSIVTEKISPSANGKQEFERSVIEDKKLNTHYIKKVDVKKNMEEVDIMDNSIATSVTKNVENKAIFHEPAKHGSFIKTEDIDDKIQSNLVMSENSNESTDLIQIDKDWADFDAIEFVIEGGEQEQLISNGEEILYDCNNDVTKTDNKSEDYCRESQESVEINPEMKGDSEKKDVKIIDEKSHKCLSQMIKSKLLDQTENFEIKDIKSMNISSGSNCMETCGNSFKVDPQSWNINNGSKSQNKMAENCPKSHFRMAKNYPKSEIIIDEFCPESQSNADVSCTKSPKTKECCIKVEKMNISTKECCIKVEKMNISTDNLMEVDGVRVSFKIDKKLWERNPQNNGPTKKNVVRKRTKTSWIWKYLTQDPDDGDMATSGRTRVICNLCSKSLIYNKAYLHLQRYHANNLEPKERKGNKNFWMTHYAIPDTESGNKLSSGSVTCRKGYTCKLCSKKVAVSHFLQSFKMLHKHMLEGL